MAPLQTPDEFKIIAIGSRKQETADAVAKRFDIPHAFADDLALINHPEVELVAVVTSALDHARLARLVIAAGKDVYSEWPLSTTTAESKELLALAKAKGVRHVVGLQRRFGPSSQYLQDLIKQNYVGQMRLAVSQQDVAYLYRAYAQDRRDGTSQAANFADAVRQHQLIDQMFETSKRTFG